MDPGESPTDAAIREFPARGRSAACLSTAPPRPRFTEARVKTHESAILRKLEVRDRVQAIVLAYDLGVVRPRPSS